MSDTNVAIVGAGPYGLSVSAHLRRAGTDVRIFGEPMSFWRTMPQGMMLRSNWPATCIAEFEGPLSLDSYQSATGIRFGRPVPLERFIEYGEWVQQQVAPDVDRRQVQSVARDADGFRLTVDGDSVRARRVVVAAGIAPFVWRPTQFDALPPELASHSADHRDLSIFAGRSVLVVGGGQSALESAALMKEAGADVEVLVRKDRINWLHGGKYHRMLGKYSKLVYAPTDVGPMGLSRVVAVPDLFRRFPRSLQGPMARRSIRPAGAAWLVPRLTDIPIHLGETIIDARPLGDGLRVTLSGGGTRDVDHVLFGTGYRVDINRYPFLPSELLGSVRQTGGYPILGPGLESSVPRLHFLGAPASWSFGPIMRFVSGSWYASRAVLRSTTGSGEPDKVGHPTALPNP
jgi:hypothetical protein